MFFFLLATERNRCTDFPGSLNLFGSEWLLHNTKDLHVCQLLTLQGLPVHLDFTLFGENLYLTSFGYGTAARRMKFLEAAWCRIFKPGIKKFLNKIFFLAICKNEAAMSIPSRLCHLLQQQDTLCPSAACSGSKVSPVLAAVLGQHGPWASQVTPMGSDLHLDSEQREIYFKGVSWPNYKAISFLLL